MAPSASTTQQRGFLGYLNAWFLHPFNSQGDAFSWVLTIGLVLVIVWFWQVILIDLTKELENV